MDLPHTDRIVVMNQTARLPKDFLNSAVFVLRKEVNGKDIY